MQLIIHSFNGNFVIMILLNKTLRACIYRFVINIYFNHDLSQPKCVFPANLVIQMHLHMINVNIMITENVIYSATMF